MRSTGRRSTRLIVLHYFLFQVKGEVEENLLLCEALRPEAVEGLGSVRGLASGAGGPTDDCAL